MVDGPGDDIIVGGFDGDLLVGGPGNDELYGVDDDDILIGGPVLITLIMETEQM